MVELKHNDKMIADGIKKGLDALSLLAQIRLDFIESKGLLQEYFAYIKSVLAVDSHLEAYKKTFGIEPHPEDKESDECIHAYKYYDRPSPRRVCTKCRKVVLL